MVGIAQVAVTAEQVGHAADFPPAHRVGLAGKRKRACARLADLARGQVQIDQCCVFSGAAARLVQALAIQTERGLGCSEQLGSGKQIFFFNAARFGHDVWRVVTHRGFE